MMIQTLALLGLLGALVAAGAYFWVQPKDRHPVVAFMVSCFIGACLAIVIGRDVLQ